jgi:allantoicase
MIRDPNVPDFVYDYANLASARLGATVVTVTDEFFADRSRMLQDAPAVFVPDKYDDNGKWMDGWETRRRRHGGHDWAVVKLAVPGVIKGLDIDTSHFTGNFPPAASVEVCRSDAEPNDKTVWTPLLPISSLGSSRHHYFAAESAAPVNYVRLQIFPDGGIARFRVYGAPVPSWKPGDAKTVHELSALKNGGSIVAFNDAHYGNVAAMLIEGRGRNMGDGWETRRRREPGNDWIIVALGGAGVVEKIEVDTAFYKGNFPDRCSVQAAKIEQGTRASIITQSQFWPVLMGEQKLSADTVHTFGSGNITKSGAVTHVKLNIFPDGGISRLRIFGKLAT